jgi:hypothetical protein
MKPMKCPKCQSDMVMSRVTAYVEVWVNINTFEVEEQLDEAVFDDPTSVYEAICGECEYEWEVKTVVVNGLYEYRVWERD